MATGVIDEKAGLSRVGRNRKAFAVAADRCRARGRCVTACPERAIRLAPALG